MKPIYLYIVILWWLCIACEFGKQGSNEQMYDDSTFTDNAVVLNDYSTIVQDVILKEQGVVRGFNFGDTVLLVQDRERADLLEDSLKDRGFITYTFKLDDENKMVDIRYLFDESNRIEGFLVDIYHDEIKQLSEDFTAFFDDRYGTGVTSDQSRLWESQRGFLVELSKQQSDIDAASGIQIRFILPDGSLNK